MNSRILPLIITIVIALTIAGCKSKGNENNGSSNVSNRSNANELKTPGSELSGAGPNGSPGGGPDGALGAEVAGGAHGAGIPDDASGVGSTGGVSGAANHGSAPGPGSLGSSSGVGSPEGAPGAANRGSAPVGGIAGGAHGSGIPVDAPGVGSTGGASGAGIAGGAGNLEGALETPDRRLEPCQTYCGAGEQKGECVLSLDNSQSLCAINGIVNTKPCGPTLCHVERQPEDCHSYCESQTNQELTISADGRVAADIRNNYKAYCQMDDRKGFPKCSNGNNFCTANQCDLGSAKVKTPVDGETCIYAWEGQDTTGGHGAASIVMMYRQGRGWVFSNLGCKYDGQKGTSFQRNGATQVRQCFDEMEETFRETEAETNYRSALNEFSHAVNQLDPTMPLQGKPVHVLPRSKHITSCSQLLLVMNNDFTTNFLLSFDENNRDGAMTGQSAFLPDYSMVNFRSNPFTINKYAMLQQKMATRISNLCYASPVTRLCSQQPTCRAHGLLKEQVNSMLFRHTDNGYKISELQCGSRKFNFDADENTWIKIQRALAKRYGVQHSADEMLKMKHDQLARNLGQRQLSGSSGTSKLGLPRLLKDTDKAHENLNSCSHVYVAMAENAEYYIRELTHSVSYTASTADSNKMRERLEAAYTNLFGYRLHKTFMPVLKETFSDDHLNKIDSEIGIIVDALCVYAEQVTDEEVARFHKGVDTCSYKSISKSGRINTMYISWKPMNNANEVVEAVAKTTMDFIQKSIKYTMELFDKAVTRRLNVPEQKLTAAQIVHDEVRVAPEYVDTRPELHDGRRLKVDIIGVTCQRREFSSLYDWSRRDQNFAIREIFDTCTYTSFFPSSEQSGKWDEEFKNLFQKVLYEGSGAIEVELENFGSDSDCEAVGSRIFSNYDALNDHGELNIQKENWSQLMGMLMPNAYPDGKGPVSQSLFLDPYGSINDNLCDLAYACQYLGSNQ